MNDLKQIAILTDVHSLYEPLEAVLLDIKNRGITEIYSLGDNISVGPNPSEVLNLLDEYGVRSVAGNAEYYVSLGIKPFSSYFHAVKEASTLWTLSKLNEEQIGKIKLYPASIDLLLGSLKISLCHFANDVRFDFYERSTWSYQDNLKIGNKAYKQFLYTNSPEQLEFMSKIIRKYGVNSPYMKGYLSALENPLFSDKDIPAIKHRVDFYDAIIQGHVHFKIYEESDKTKFYTIRAVGMAYDMDPVDTASYVILKEKQNSQGYDIEEVLVKYDREKMISSILNSNIPDKTTIRTFTSIIKKKINRL